MRRNPRGNQRGDKLGDGEVFPGEDGHGDGVKQAAEGHELVEAVCLANFILEDYGGADGEECDAREVGPEDGAGDEEGCECERKSDHNIKFPKESGLAQ